MDQTVTIYLDSSHIPGTSDAGSILEVHAKTTLVYGTPKIPYTIVRADPKERRAEIQALKTRKFDSRTLKEYDEGLNMRIDGDLTPDHWEAIARLPEEPDDEPSITVQFQWEGEFVFGESVLDLHGIHIPLSNPRPLINFLRRKLEEKAGDRLREQQDSCSW